MTKSNESRLHTLWSKEIGTLWNGDRVQIDGVTPAPPYKVGKQFPYENARRAREDAAIADMDGTNQLAMDEKIAGLTAPHPKSPEQQAIEAAFLGRDHHQRVGKHPTRKHGGDGTVRRSSMRRPHRAIVIESDIDYTQFDQTNLYAQKENA